MKLSVILAPLLAAKVDPEVILDAVRAWEAEHDATVEAGREKARARWHKWKDGKQANGSKRLQTTEAVSNNSREGARVEDNLQTKNLAGQEEKKENARVARSSFPAFWSIYPHKVGKRDAEAAFSRALKRADVETILAGVRRYAAKTDDRPWCNPSTFLNQDRWADDPARTVVRPATGPPHQGRRTIMDDYHDIARERGWTNEPESIPVDHRNAQRLPSEPGSRHESVVVDLRRRADGSFGSGGG